MLNLIRLEADFTAQDDRTFPAGTYGAVVADDGSDLVTVQFENDEPDDAYQFENDEPDDAYVEVDVPRAQAVERFRADA